MYRQFLINHAIVVDDKEIDIDEAEELIDDVYNIPLIDDQDMDEDIDEERNEIDHDI